MLGLPQDAVVVILLVVLLCYLIGAIPFGYLVARAVKGIDIREHGSRNIGATNVGRVLGLKWFFVVFLLDFAKAAIPVSLLQMGLLWYLTPEGWYHSTTACIGGISILLGNMFPVFLGFRGGKGAATGTGVMLPLAPLPTAAAFATFLVVFLMTRYVSLGSMLASLALVIAQLIQFRGEAFSGEAAPVTWLCIMGAALVIVRHRSNIVRLLNGTESRIKRKAANQ
jgi:acyl phosphate:glycerol-3-phosphate acyltransferase